MNDILLTPEEQRQIHKDAADAFFLKDDGAYDGLSFPESVKLAQRELLASIDEAICRAQVRNVALRLREHMDAPCEKFPTKRDQDCEHFDCADCQVESFMAALKAAGEGK